MDAPDVPAQQDYGFYIRGTSQIDAPANGFPAPDTAVLTMLSDIGAASDDVRARRNGTQVGTSGAASAGTGNFLAYPLYIGMRNGSTLPLNGQIFSLIVRFGANLTADQINSTEAWVGGKVGFNWANLISPTIFARDETAVLDRFNQTIERRA
jgi:hypothetical protein